MLPMPEKGMRNEKFIYFYRPYNFNVLTRKFMHFDGKDAEVGFEQPSAELIDFVQIMTERKRRNEKAELMKKYAN